MHDRGGGRAASGSVLPLMLLKRVRLARCARAQESVKDYTNAIRLESSNGNFYYNRAISYMCLAPPDYDKVRAPARVAAAPCVSRWPRSWRNVRAIF